MPNNPQAMEITPRSEITFRGPYTEVVESVLRLANPTQRPMAFKVKTTAPKQYCVRPNSGHLAAGESRDIVGSFTGFSFADLLILKKLCTF